MKIKNLARVLGSAMLSLILMTACSSDGKVAHFWDETKGSMYTDTKNAENDLLKSGAEYTQDSVQQDEESMAEKAGNAAGKMVENAGDTAKDVMQNAGNAVDNAAEQAGKAAKDTAENVGNAAEHVVDEATEKNWVPYEPEVLESRTVPLDTDDGMVSAAEKPMQFEMISGFSTKLYDKEDARISNIKLAISKVDETILQPGDTFSFNSLVGDRTAEAGFHKARALWMTEPTREIGGGVCQLSTTIYQAAQRAGLKIVEQHPHQKPVNYVEEGLDACVDYGVFDLQFMNDTDRVLKVKASCDGEYVHVTIEREVK